MANASLGDTMTFEAQFPGVCRSEDDRHLMQYIVSCALTPKQSVTFCDQRFQFQGRLGYGPEWLENSLSDDGRELVSACIAAHTNSAENPVEIYLMQDGLGGLGWPSPLTPENHYMAQLFPPEPGEHYIYIFDTQNVSMDFITASGRDCQLANENCGFGTDYAACRHAPLGFGHSCEIDDPRFNDDPRFPDGRTIDKNIISTCVDQSRPTAR